MLKTPSVASCETLTCGFWVELRGFEPLTPSMRTKWSSVQVHTDLWVERHYVAHILANRSSLPVTSCLPSGLNPSVQTPPWWCSWAVCLPVGTSHSRAVRSSAAVASRAPSGLKASARTGPTCLSTATSLPLPTSQSRDVSSSLAVASKPPSELNATAPTRP